jgi:hypothetical protein
VWADYLEAVLLTVNGWASWCAYLGWQAQLEGRTDPHLRDLLAIRLAWGMRSCWNARTTPRASRPLPPCSAPGAGAADAAAQAEEALLIDEVWQLALEAGYQRELAGGCAHPRHPGLPQPEIEVQAAFCIDVRSEPCAARWRPCGPACRRWALPASSACRWPTRRWPPSPAAAIAGPAGAGHGGHRPDPERRGPRALPTMQALQAQRQHAAPSAWRWPAWQATSRWPGAAFSFVEAAGVGYLGKLGQWLRPHTRARARDDLHGLPARYRAICRPQLAGLDTDAASFRWRRGCCTPWAWNRAWRRWCCWWGMAASRANNAHAAALDCGACCGQTGEVNARSLAHLLNDSRRAPGPARPGHHIPDGTTWFVACAAQHHHGRDRGL